MSDGIGEPLTGGDLLKMKLRRVCSWHPGGPIVMEEGDPGAPTTNGACPDCTARLHAEIKERRARQRREAERTDRMVEAGQMEPPPPLCDTCNGRPASVGTRCVVCETAARAAAVDADADARDRMEHEEGCRWCRSMRGQPAPLGGLRATCARLNGRNR